MCNNTQLQAFIEGKLPADARQGYSRQMALVKNGQAGGKATVLEKQGVNDSDEPSTNHTPIWLAVIILSLILAIIIYLRLRNGNRR